MATLPRLPLIRLQQPTQPRRATNVRQLEQFSTLRRTAHQQFILSSLVRPLRVVVIQVLAAEYIHVLGPKDKNVVEAFLLDRLHESFERQHWLATRPVEHDVRFRQD
jgi:hypothetical protein